MALGNNAEGGTHGTAVTIGNSGGVSGTAFTLVQTSGTGTVKFDNTQAAHGLLSYRCTSTASATAYVQWTVTATAAVATRMYVRFASMTANQQFLITTGGADFIISAAGLFQIADLGAIVKTFATTIVAGVWYRIEMENQAGTTTSNGYVAGRYFIGDSTTPAETAYSSNTRNAGTGTPNAALQFGMCLAINAKDFWIDDLGADPGVTTPIGPAAPAVAAFAGWGIPL